MNQRLFSSSKGLLLALGLLVTACSSPTTTTNSFLTPTPLAAPSIALGSAPSLITPIAATETPFVLPTQAATITAPPIPTSVPVPSATPSAAAPSSPTTRPVPAVSPTVAPSPKATPVAGAACTNVATFVSDVAIPDNTTVVPGQTFTKIWQLRNRGTCTWGSGYTFTFVTGQAMTNSTNVAVPETAPGNTVNVQIPMTAPTTPGADQGFWQLRDANGRAFGPRVWVLVNVSGPAAAPPLAPPATSGAAANCTNSATFVSDIAIPDNTAATAGQALTKIWRMRNRGTCAWNSTYTLAFVAGQALTATTSVPVPNTASGATADISVPLTAPTTTGTVQGFWQLKDPNGTPFGPQVWVLIRVSPAAAPNP
jgi:hypothetical protein